MLAGLPGPERASAARVSGIQSEIQEAVKEASACSSPKSAYPASHSTSPHFFTL